MVLCKDNFVQNTLGSERKGYERNQLRRYPFRAEDAKIAEVMARIKPERLCGLCELCAKTKADKKKAREKQGAIPNPSTNQNKRETIPNQSAHTTAKPPCVVSKRWAFIM